MGYCSRKYLKEKWDKVKWDMESILKVEDENQPKEVDPDDICRVICNVRDNMEAIIKELMQGLDD